MSHEFFLNLRSDNPYCQGINGILQAYCNALQNIQLYGPTNFAPVINHVAAFANAFQDGKQYFVQLIITDGVITDLELTKDAIIKASGLPMSIIIVGVGNEDFSNMRELDCDSGKLTVAGRKAKRDIVQFVEMRKFFKHIEGGAMGWDKGKLAECVLAEVPNQLVEWMRSRGLKPIKA